MSPDQRGEVGKVVVANVHAVYPDLLKRFLHVDGVPVHDGVKGEAEGAELLFLPLLEGASNFAALSMVDAPAEAVAQFGVVELGEDAPPERRIVDRAQDVDGPKHASWLNMVEIEISVLRGQCLDRRIGERERLIAEIAAWQTQRNASGARVKWKFTTEKARDKLARTYPHTVKQS